MSQMKLFSFSVWQLWISLVSTQQFVVVATHLI